MSTERHPSQRAPLSLQAILLLSLPFVALAGCAPEARDFTSGGAGGSGGSGIVASSSATTTSTSSGTICSTASDCPTFANGSATCDDGTCSFTCNSGFADCAAEVPGCETPTVADKGNCGACGVTCFLGCNAGVCSDPIEVTTGLRHTCARMGDGSVYCWGSNEWGELGDANLAQANEPRQVSLPGPAIQITAGGGSYQMFQGGHTCALMKDGTVQCWGNNDLDQLGLGVNDFNDPFPQPVVGLVNAIQIAAGGGHTCAVKSNNDLLCWGSNSEGQVGDGTMNLVTQQPTVVLNNVARVEVGLRHTCAIQLDGALYCWGNKYANMIGTDDASNPRAPAPVQMIGPVDEVSLGKEHTCARVKNELLCWGADYQGQTGLNDFTTVLYPKTVTVPDVRSLDLGPVFTGTVSGDAGEVRMWGYGPAGDGMSGGSDPKLTGLSGVSRLTLGGDYGDLSFACALKTTSEVVCWGRDTEGQLGDGPDNKEKLTPVPVLWPAGMQPGG